MTDWDIQRKEKPCMQIPNFAHHIFIPPQILHLSVKKTVQTPAIPRKSSLICFAQNVKVVQNEFDANSAQKLLLKNVVIPIIIPT